MIDIPQDASAARDIDQFAACAARLKRRLPSRVLTPILATCSAANGEQQRRGQLALVCLSASNGYRPDDKGSTLTIMADADRIGRHHPKSR
jgi:hypothetical protein